MEDSSGAARKGVKRRYKVIGIVILIVAGLLIGFYVLRETKLDKKFVAFGGDLDKVADGVDAVQQELNKHVPINKVIGVIKKANTLPRALKKAINKGDE